MLMGVLFTTLLLFVAAGTALAQDVVKVSPRRTGSCSKMHKFERWMSELSPERRYPCTHIQLASSIT